MRRASAKIILFGEHSVVHGRLAVAAGIDRGARASAKRVDGASTMVLSPWGRTVREGDDDELARAFGDVRRSLGVGPVEVHVDVDVPGGAGLGCSAAIGVAIVRAMAEASDVALDDATTQAHALAWEQVFHGNPSGVDVAAATVGGVLAFRRGSPIDRVRPASPMEIAIAWTGETSSTRAMVDQVGRQLARRPQVVERTFDGIDTIAKKGLVAIEHGQWREVGQLMDLNHALLTSLMVSTERLEQACSIARNTGAAGAKLTGAGGGGCAIALAPGCSKAIVDAWAAAGIEGFVTTIGVGSIANSKREVHA